jgi:hypothetical protein
MDLYLLNELNKLESGVSRGSAVGALLPSSADGTILQGKECWASIVRHNDRNQQDNVGFTSSGPNSTWYAYMGDADDAEFALASALHQDHMYGGTTARSNYYNGGVKRMVFGDGAKVGTAGLAHGKDSSYMGFTTNVLFVKNPTASDITATVYTHFSSYWNSGYEGSGCWTAIPNSTNKAATTSLAWTQKFQTTSNSTGTTNSFSQSFPAGKTVALVLNASDYYWTGTTYNYYMTRDTWFYNTQFMTAAGLVCDLEMAQTAYMARIYGSNYSGGYRLWNECAKNFPAA